MLSLSLLQLSCLVGRMNSPSERSMSVTEAGRLLLGLVGVVGLLLSNNNGIGTRASEGKISL